MQKRQCPAVHVFGARETTVASGYGSSITVVDDILAYYSGSTSEAINYPACKSQLLVVLFPVWRWFQVFGNV